MFGCSGKEIFSHENVLLLVLPVAFWWGFFFVRFGATDFHASLENVFLKTCSVVEKPLSWYCLFGRKLTTEKRLNGFHPHSPLSVYIVLALSMEFTSAKLPHLSYFVLAHKHNAKRSTSTIRCDCESIMHFSISELGDTVINIFLKVSVDIETLTWYYETLNRVWYIQIGCEVCLTQTFIA